MNSKHQRIDTDSYSSSYQSHFQTTRVPTTRAPGGFLKALRRIAGNTFRRVDDVTAELVTNRSAISSLDNALDAAPKAVDNGVTKINGVEFSNIAGDLRVGNLRSAFSKMGLPNVISAADEVNFKKIFVNGKMPDEPLQKMVNQSTSVKAANPDLAVPNTSTLNPTQASKVKGWMETLKTTAIAGGVLAGIIAIIVLGVDLLQDLDDATEARNGVFLVDTSAGKTTSCRDSKRTCDPAITTGAEPGPCSAVPDVPPNVRMLIDDCTKSSFSSVKTAIEATLTNAPLPNSAGAEAWLNTAPNHEELKAWLDSDYDGAKTYTASYDCPVDYCINYDPTATAFSYEFADLSRLPDNQTLKCITNSTILDTLVDVGIGVGKDIFGGLGDKIKGLISSLGNWPLIIGGILLLLLIVSIIMKIFKK